MGRSPSKMLVSQLSSARRKSHAHPYSTQQSGTMHIRRSTQFEAQCSTTSSRDQLGRCLVGHRCAQDASRDSAAICQLRGSIQHCRYLPHRSLERGRHPFALGGTADADSIATTRATGSASSAADQSGRLAGHQRCRYPPVGRSRLALRSCRQAQETSESSECSGLSAMQHHRWRLELHLRHPTLSACTDRPPDQSTSAARAALALCLQGPLGAADPRRLSRAHPSRYGRLRAFRCLVRLGRYAQLHPEAGLARHLSCPSQTAS